MAAHNDLGKKGETLGKRYLEQQGYRVLNVNWRYSYYEIDIIASKNEMLHFIEVKTRRSQRYGLPEESVDRTKFAKLLLAAEQYQYQCPGWKRVQYDILSIQIFNGNVEYYLIEDVYI